MNDRNTILKFYIVLMLLTLAGFGIVGKMIYLQFFYDKEIVTKAIKSIREDAVIEPTRGDIYSSDGKLLATSVASFEVAMDPNCPALTQKIFDENIDSLSLCLSQMFPEKSKSQFKKEIISARDKGSQYYRISYKIKYSKLKKMQTFPLFRRGRFKGGFICEGKYKREKPFGQLASRTIGTVATESGGGVGLEEAYDTILRGVEGYTIKERIPGNLWMPVENAKYIEPIDGKNIISTIDISLQDIVESALERKLKKHEAEFGTAILMEVKTGKVRAIANLKRHGNGYYLEGTNYAVAHATDPGSTFKLASVIVAIEDGYVKPNDIIETGNGRIKYYNKVMKDTKEGGYGEISFKRSFEVSSNVGVSKIIHDNYRHQPMKFVEGLQKLCLDKPLGVVIKGETSPVVHNPSEKEWSGLSLTQMSIGYELQITPLQMLALYNAVANNGCLIKPSFVEAISYHGKIIEEFSPEVIKSRICSQKTVDSVRSMLEGVVENGTAKHIRNKDFSIAGKTGTAQMQYGKAKEDLQYHASFIGYFPADDPVFSCAVSIYEPKKNGFYGGQVAAPVFKEIADNIYSTNKYFTNNRQEEELEKLIIPSAKKGNKEETAKVLEFFKVPNNSADVASSDWVVPSAGKDRVKFTPISFSDRTKIPNVLNMGLKDAILVLENYGLKVEVIGRGKVRKMNPAHGNTFVKGDVVTLVLEI